MTIEFSEGLKDYLKNWGKMKLCWKCRESWAREYGGRGFMIAAFSWVHCHHDEPEEKPKCWCETKYPINPSFYYENGDPKNKAIYLKFNFCPECGRKFN